MVSTVCTFPVVFLLLFLTQLRPVPCAKICKVDYKLCETGAEVFLRLRRKGSSRIPCEEHSPFSSWKLSFFTSQGQHGNGRKATASMFHSLTSRAHCSRQEPGHILVSSVLLSEPDICHCSCNSPWAKGPPKGLNTFNCLWIHLAALEAISLACYFLFIIACSFSMNHKDYRSYQLLLIESSPHRQSIWGDSSVSYSQWSWAFESRVSLYFDYYGKNIIIKIVWISYDE